MGRRLLWAVLISSAEAESWERCQEDFANLRVPCAVGAPNTFRPFVHLSERVSLLSMADQSRETMKCCQSAQLRVWELGFFAAYYLTRARQVVQDQKVLRTLEWLFESVGNEVHYGIFCGPMSCDQDVIGQLVMQQLVERLMDEKKMSLPKDFVVARNETSADELAPWRELPVDFVVAGMPHCGTSSMHKNLYKHPDIDFTLGDFEEDYSIFAQGQRNKLLPTKAQLEKHKEQIASSVRKNNVKLMGLKNPIIAMYPLSYYSIFFIKRTKLILMVCDPVGRLERRFMTHHYCHHEDMEAAIERRDISKFRDLRDCDKSMMAVLQRHRRSWLQLERIGTHLLELIKLFGHERLLIVHAASIRDHPAETYGHVVRWLGLRPFPTDSQSFKRMNFRRGHRTDLCRNQSLQASLKRVLTREYSALRFALQWQWLMLKQPTALREVESRITRCDIPEELTAGPCGLHDLSLDGCWS